MVGCEATLSVRSPRPIAAISSAPWSALRVATVTGAALCGLHGFSSQGSIRPTPLLTTTSSSAPAAAAASAWGPMSETLSARTTTALPRTSWRAAKSAPSPA